MQPAATTLHPILTDNSMTQPEELRLTLGGHETRLRLRRARTAGRPALLCLHGWSDSADTFKPLWEALADTDATLLAPDLPNFGEAADAAPGAQLPQYIAFARAAIEYASTCTGTPGPVVPLGQSLGGRAMLMALAQGVAAPVHAAIAIAPAPLELPAWQKMLVRNASLAPSVSQLAEPAPFERQLEELLKSFKRTCLAAPDTVPESVYRDYLRHYTPPRVARHMESLRSIGAELEQPLDLGGLHIPIELIWGTLDRMAPFAGALRYREALPDAHLTRLEGGGHHAHLERVEAVAGVVRGRLAEAAERYSP